jgi:hypothetical protein
MSAFLVGHDHIDGLLTFAINAKASYYDPKRETRVNFTRVNATEIGCILQAENVRSLNCRYGDDNATEAYTFNPFGEFYSMRHSEVCLIVLKACDCFDYQACETSDYEESLAWRIVDAIRSAALHALPGYSNARGWELRRLTQPVGNTGNQERKDHDTSSKPCGGAGIRGALADDRDRVQSDLGARRKGRTGRGASRKSTVGSGE